MTVQQPTSKDIPALVLLARKTFLESHGHSACKVDIENYLAENYTETNFHNELANKCNVYYLIWAKGVLVGYSKLIYNQPHANVNCSSTAKLERIYLLESHHGLGLGEHLLNFNVDLAKKNKQSGIWLFTWVANKRAIQFYQKSGFKIIGSHDFRISDSHTNPNHQFLLTF